MGAVDVLSVTDRWIAPLCPSVPSFQQLRLNLDRSIRGLGLIDFKVVLQTISNIQSLTISVEIRIKEIQETYNVLEEHQLKVN